MTEERRQRLSAAKRHPARPRGGRPTREDSEQLRDQLLEVATDLFLSQGYGATSIEAVASRARVSKRTFYSRFSDKPALLRAVVQRMIDGLRPPADVPLLSGKELEEILRNLARLILQAALSPKALALHRLMVAESQRFPDVAAAVAKVGGRQEAVTLIARLLQEHAQTRAPGTGLDAARAGFAAEQFLQMVVSVPQMRALGLGQAMTLEELERWATQSVAFFVGGLGALAGAGDRRAAPGAACQEHGILR